jgi:hypothetical protein
MVYNSLSFLFLAIIGVKYITGSLLIPRNAGNIEDKIEGASGTEGNYTI